MTIKKKPIKKDNKVVPKKEYVCFRCEKLLDEKKFYNSHSTIYRAKMPVCKECLFEAFYEFEGMYNSIYKAIYRICELLDIYYYKNIIDSVYEKYLKTEGAEKVFIFRSYIRQINSLPEYKNLTFKDSDVNVSSLDVKEVELDGRDVDIKNWGRGFKSEQYDILNEKYRLWCTSAPHSDHADVVVLRNICKAELASDEKFANGEDTKKANEQLMNMIKIAGLDGKSKKKAEDGDKSDESFGMFIKTIEEKEPADRYADKKMYEDWCGYGENYKNYYIRPLRNMVENRRDFPNVEKRPK